MLLPNTPPPSPTDQRLFWLLRVVTSLFIGSVILGEYEAQLTWTLPLTSVPQQPAWPLLVSAWQFLLQGGHPDMPPSAWPQPLTLTIVLRGVSSGKPSWMHFSKLPNILFGGKQVKMNICGEKVFGDWREEMGEGFLLCFENLANS